MPRTAFLSLLTLLLVLPLAGCEPPAPPADDATATAHEKRIRDWRAQRVEKLRRPDGWLSLVGLFWLEEGVQRFGSGAEMDLRLTDERLPETVGSFVLSAGKVTFSPAPDVPVLQNGQLVTASLPMRPDTRPQPTVLTLGSFRLYVIERDGRFGLRVKDSQSPARTGFAGLEYFPIRADWRVRARFVPYEPARRIPVLNVVGMQIDMHSPGALVFEIDGTEYRLDPVLENPDAKEMFIMFADRTSGRSTYGGGRYLYVSHPDANGEVWIDFNKAYNPPCVFSHFATCPLPPLQNRLELPITAGEKMYGRHE